MAIEDLLDLHFLPLGADRLDPELREIFRQLLYDVCVAEVLELRQLHLYQRPSGRLDAPVFLLFHWPPRC